MPSKKKTGNEMAELYGTPDVPETTEEETVNVPVPQQGSIDLHQLWPDDDTTSNDNDPTQEILAVLTRPTDVDSLTSMEQMLFLERGKYQWIDGKCTVTTKFQPDNHQEGDLSPKGRILITVGGTVQQVDNTSKKGPFTFTFSPDKRLSATRDSLDFFSQAYAKLSLFFVKKMARRHKDDLELVRFVASAKYSMYISLSSSNRNNLQEFQV